MSTRATGDDRVRTDLIFTADVARALSAAARPRLDGAATPLEVGVRRTMEDVARRQTERLDARELG